MSEGEFHIKCRMCDGNELLLLEGASRGEVIEALDCLALDTEENSMWMVFKNGKPILINPKYIMYAEMSD